MIVVVYAYYCVCTACQSEDAFLFSSLRVYRARAIVRHRDPRAADTARAAAAAASTAAAAASAPLPAPPSNAHR